jgi:thioredoxin-dependent peroxiredoxin
LIESKSVKAGSTKIISGPQEGARAPAFTLPSDGDGKVALKDLTDVHVVLFFYPKDDTSGCTKEAIAFTENLAKFKRAGAIVLGVSRDTVSKHDKFKSKHQLKITLLSDEDGEVCEKYGVWVEKNMYGRKYMGIERATFLISGGKIVRRWRKVKVAGHAEEVLEAVKTL